MKEIDRSKHTLLLKALGELASLTGDEEELHRIARDTEALTESHEAYLTLLERLRDSVAAYDALHADLRHRTCRSLRTLRRSARRTAVVPITVTARNPI